VQPNRKDIRPDDLARNQAEAESTRFRAHMNHCVPEPRFRNIFSELDITTSSKVVWDLWIKFPKRIRKEDELLFREDILRAWRSRFTH